MPAFSTGLEFIIRLWGIPGRLIYGWDGIPPQLMKRPGRAGGVVLSILDKNI
jgi:hypothetical protein